MLKRLLGTIHLKGNDLDEAERLLSEILETRESKDDGRRADIILRTKRDLGVVHLRSKNYLQAERYLLEAVNGMRAYRGEIPEVPAGYLIEVYEAWDKQDEADKLRAEMQQIGDK